MYAKKWLAFNLQDSSYKTLIVQYDYFAENLALRYRSAISNNFLLFHGINFRQYIFTWIFLFREDFPVDVILTWNALETRNGVETFNRIVKHDFFM